VKIFSQLILMGIVGMMLVTVAFAEGGIVAEGDGFVISQQDIADIQAYFSERGFESNEREYVSGALKLFLFAEEAAADGLAAKPDASLSGKEKVERLYKLHKLYANHLIESYPLSKEAIESYFLAYPEKFVNSESLFDEDRKQVYAQDTEKKEWIRNKILAAKKSRLLENEFQRLKEKYHVKLR